MTSDEPTTQALPADMNDLRGWVELELGDIDDVFSDLEERASEPTPGTFRDLMREEIIADEEIYSDYGTIICSPSIMTRAMLIWLASAEALRPPARSIASCTRLP